MLLWKRVVCWVDVVFKIFVYVIDFKCYIEREGLFL